jgi:hypothetical protein
MRRVYAAVVLTLWLMGGAALAQGSGFTAQQRAAAFDAADVNHDGKLSRDEFKNTPRGRAPNDPDANWKASDKDGDGYVSRKEFIEPMTGESLDAPSAPAAPTGGGLLH